MFHRVKAWRDQLSLKQFLCITGIALFLFGVLCMAIALSAGHALGTSLLDTGEAIAFIIAWAFAYHFVDVVARVIAHIIAQERAQRRNEE